MYLSLLNICTVSCEGSATGYFASALLKRPEAELITRSSSNCSFLTCIQVSQEAGQVVWYSHLFQNFPQFIVIHTAKGFGIVNKAEIDVFLELSCFFHDPADVGNLISGSLLSYKKEHIRVSSNEVDEPGAYYTE